MNRPYSRADMYQWSGPACRSSDICPLGRLCVVSWKSYTRVKGSGPVGTSLTPANAGFASGKVLQMPMYVLATNWGKEPGKSVSMKSITSEPCQR